MKKPNQAKVSKHENGVDFISNMPDPILQLILQGLPNTEEVVRTSILSTRWRYLWTSIPYFPSLDIDCYRTAPTPSLMFPKKKFKDFVTWCLANKTVDLDSFRLCCASYYRDSTVNGWIEATVNRNVKSLDLLFCHKSEVLRFNFYRRTTLHLPDCIKLRFRALRVLELNKVCFSVKTIEDLVGMSPLLEELALIDCFIRAIDPVCISSPMLKTLVIRNWKNIIYENQLIWCGIRVSCPELVSFEYVGLRNMSIFENINSLKKAVILPDDKMHQSISHRMEGEICKVLANIFHVESLSVNLYFIQSIDVASDQEGNFPASFPDLKTLEETTTIVLRVFSESGVSPSSHSKGTSNDGILDI